MSVNFNANSVLHYGTRLHEVSLGNQSCTGLTESRILDTVLEMAMMSLDVAAVPLITSSYAFPNLNLLSQILLLLLLL